MDNKINKLKNSLSEAIYEQMVACAIDAEMQAYATISASYEEMRETLLKSGYTEKEIEGYSLRIRSLFVEYVAAHLCGLTPSTMEEFYHDVYTSLRAG